VHNFLIAPKIHGGNLGGKASPIRRGVLRSSVELPTISVLQPGPKGTLSPSETWSTGLGIVSDTESAQSSGN
jgi:hypothetical protein